jgi:hypothetical protein
MLCTAAALLDRQAGGVRGTSDEHLEGVERKEFEGFKEFKEFELEGSAVRCFFTAVTSRANIDHP